MDAVLVSSKYTCRSSMINPIMMNIYSPVIRYSAINNIVSNEGINKDINKFMKTYPLYKKDIHTNNTNHKIVRSMSWSN